MHQKKRALTFLTEADQERVRPKKTIKKKGPHRSQSLSAFPGSSLFGFGNTTSFRLLPILPTSLFTVSHTGSVNVFAGDPNPLAFPPSEPPLPAGGTGTGVTFCAGASGGRLDWTKGEDVTGIEGRIGLGGRAGRTDPGPDWKPPFIMFSISSMSDWDDWYSGTVSLCDILSIGFPTVSFTGELEFAGID